MGERARHAATLAAITALYVLAGRLGLEFAYVNASVTAIWPPAGIAVATLLVLGLRAWPAVAIGAFLLNLIQSGHAALSLAIAAGNTLEYVAAAALTNRFARGRHAFERGPDILRFVAFGALLAPMIAATVGTAGLRLFDRAAEAETMRVWLTWWLGDATGIAVFGPACVLWTVPQPPMRAGRYEVAALLVSLAVVCYVSVGAPSVMLRDMPLAALMLPLLLWSAFRFNTRITATLSVVMLAISVYRILNEYAFFSLGEPAVSLLVVECLVAVVAMLMLSVATEAGARGRVEAELRLLNEHLERHVHARTVELTTTHDRLVEAQAVAHVGSWEWNVEGDTIWWSEEMCRIFGMAGPPGGYQAFLARVHPDDRDLTNIAVGDAGGSGRPFSFDHRIIRPDGEQRVVQANGRVELDASGRVVRMVGTGHDVTGRKQDEEARVQLVREQAKLREAEDSNRAKDAFLATLSHELRTPLNAALGWAHLLRDGRLDERREQHAIDAIYRNLTIQSRLVEDILDISRIAKGDLPMDRGIVDVGVVFSAAAEIVRQAGESKDVTITIACPAGTIIAGDARRLQQVAWNLLDNAVKFAFPGGRVTVSVQTTPGGIECRVEDDGPGIASEFLPHIFEQFRQADASVTRAHGGLGLGLAISQEIVKGHGGTIAASNRAGGGAAFVIRLPRQGPEGVAAPGDPLACEAGGGL